MRTASAVGLTPNEHSISFSRLVDYLGARAGLREYAFDLACELDERLAVDRL